MHYIEDIVCRHVTKNDNVPLGNFYEISHLLVNQHRRYCNAMGFKRSENSVIAIGVYFFQSCHWIWFQNIVLQEDHTNRLQKNLFYVCAKSDLTKRRNACDISRNLKSSELEYSFSAKPSRRKQADFVLSNLPKKTWRMTTNTALLGLVIGAYPSISDKEMTSKKLVSHHLILLFILIISLLLSLPPHPHYLYYRSPLFCWSSWSPSSTGLTTTPGLCQSHCSPLNISPLLLLL